MSSRTSVPQPQLPDELMESMHRIAGTTGSASRPFPALDQAITRSHRRRVALAAASVAAVLAVGAGTATLVLNPAPAQKSSTASQSVADGVALAPELQQAGYAGPVGGSLADDQAFVDQARALVAQQAGFRADRTVSASDVLMFFAGDIEGRRIVVAGYPPASTGDSALALAAFTGEEGAGAAALSMSAPDQAIEIDRSLLGDPVGLVVKDTDDRGVVFVIAPNAKRVELGTERQFLPGGEVKTVWEKMAKQGGSAWVSPAGPGALRIAQYRADLEVGDLPHDLTDYPSDSLAGVAAPDTRWDAVPFAGQELMSLGLTGSETPVLASTNTSGAYPLTAVLLRSPDNGYVAAVNVTTPSTSPVGTAQVSASVVADGEFTSPDDAMVAIELGDVLGYGDGSTPAQYAVIAPKGATTVKVGPDTAVVKNRVALLSIPADRFAETGGDSTGTLPITAVDAAGNDLATVNSQQPFHATTSTS